ncbi:MAG: STAS domain-containing protein, partial [Myxococcales bacterium]|nr:STAS domain-containing protein [Myxococcales bacterium]
VVTLGKRDTERVSLADADPSRELVSLGAANLLGGLFSSPPVSASLSRSAIARDARVKSPLSNGFAALFVIAACYFLDSVLERIPMPALAGVIIVATVSIISLKELKALFWVRRQEAALALTTAALTLVWGVQAGVLAGVGISLFALLINASRPKIVELGQVEGSHYRSVTEFDAAEPVSDALILRIDSSLHFANAGYVVEQILSMVEHCDREVKTLVLDGRGVNHVDATAAEALGELVHELSDRHIALRLSNFKREARRTLKRAKVVGYAKNDDAGEPIPAVEPDPDPEPENA